METYTMHSNLLSVWPMELWRIDVSIPQYRTKIKDYRAHGDSFF